MKTCGILVNKYSSAIVDHDLRWIVCLDRGKLMDVGLVSTFYQKVEQKCWTCLIVSCGFDPSKND